MEEKDQPSQPECDTEKKLPPHDAPEQDNDSKITPPETTPAAREQISISPQAATTSAQSSASSSVSPTLPPPALFVNALNLQPNTASDKNDSTTVAKTATGYDSMDDDDSTHTATLTSKFKEDPSAVLKLLQRSLPMDKLASLIRSECRANKKQLKSLQKQLEEAYVTLMECAGQKEVLKEKIEESNKKIGIKRRQMEDLREELRVLGEEELQLKKKRDTSYAKCSEIKKRLTSSREAQQQIAAFTAKTNSAPNSVS